MKRHGKAPVALRHWSRARGKGESPPPPASLAKASITSPRVVATGANVVVVHPPRPPASRPDGQRLQPALGTGPARRFRGRTRFECSHAASTRPVENWWDLPLAGAHAGPLFVTPHRVCPSASANVRGSSSTWCPSPRLFNGTAGSLTGGSLFIAIPRVCVV